MLARRRNFQLQPALGIMINYSYLIVKSNALGGAISTNSGGFSMNNMSSLMYIDVLGNNSRTTGSGSSFSSSSSVFTGIGGAGGVGGGSNGANQLEMTSLLDESSLTYQPWLSMIILIIATLMSLTTIIGNVLVITAFIIEKSLRKYSNYFILNLSIADLLIGILIPPYAPFLLLKRTWRIGKTACTVWLVLDYVVGSASVLCIVVISLDR